VSKILPDNYWPFDEARISKTWIDNKKHFRMRCDYCHRVVIGVCSNSISCTACGHGHIKEIKPKNWCSICGEPQYDNVSKPPVRIECDKCLENKVTGINHLESRLKTQFKDTADAKRKCERHVLNKERVVESELRKARKEKGWSLTELGIHLGVSKQAVHKMEVGKLPYGEKAKEWLKSSTKTYTPTQEPSLVDEQALIINKLHEVKNGIRDHVRGDNEKGNN